MSRTEGTETRRGAADEQGALLQALLQPTAYPDTVEKVEMVETHISFIFFTGEYVYKVKKPVDFGFLDFTTLEKRRGYCHREVELNRRIAPDVYLAVVPVVRKGSSYFVEGADDQKNRATEYAVKMRQLPKDRVLATMLEQGEVTPVDVRKLAEVIVRFHAQAETSPAISKAGTVEAVRRNVDENFSQTERYVGATISREMYDDLLEYSQGFLECKGWLFDQRISEGRVRDCHGDLHAGQIFLEGTPEQRQVSIIDCIEFNERFRHCDVAEDMAFLAMDLDFHGKPDYSRQFVQEYVDLSGDAGLTQMLDFYKIYRAYVRGKVNSFRTDDPGAATEEKVAYRKAAEAYFRLAHSYIQASYGPQLLMVTGLSGTGKSTVAKELARRWDMEYISSDEVRKELSGVPAGQHIYEGYGQGIYSSEGNRRTYAEMVRRAGDLLKTGRSVVLDATFRHAAQRGAAVAQAYRSGAEAWVIECTLDEAEVRHRIEQRTEEGTSSSDARWETYLQQRAEWEPVAEVRGGRYIRVDTSLPLGEAMRGLVSTYHHRALCEGG